MDRSVIQQRLAETEERIANGESQIAQQRRLIAELESSGSPASHAKYLQLGWSCCKPLCGIVGIGCTAGWSSREMTIRRFPPP
jgi:hypothetical protein